MKIDVALNFVNTASFDCMIILSFHLIWSLLRGIYMNVELADNHAELASGLPDRAWKSNWLEKLLRQRKIQASKTLSVGQHFLCLTLSW